MKCGRMTLERAFPLLLALTGCNQPSVSAEPPVASAPAAPSAKSAPAVPALVDPKANPGAKKTASMDGTPSAAGGAPSTAIPSAPSGGAASTSAAKGSAPASTSAKSTAKTSGKVDSWSGGELCKGAPREGCVPKDDPSGLVARE